MRSLELLTVGKAGGINGLLPDVLKCCDGPLLDYILRLYGRRGVCPQSAGILC